MKAELYTVFIRSLMPSLPGSLDGATTPFCHYDNLEAAEAHRDHINKAIAKNNPLKAGQSFVRTAFVRSHFGGSND